MRSAMAQPRHTEKFLTWMPIAAILLALSSFAVFSWWDRQETIRAGESSRSETAALMEAHVRSAIEGQSTILSEMAEIILSSPDWAKSPGLWERLRRLQSRTPSVTSLSVVDPDGNVVLTTLRPGSPALNVSGREFFSAHLAKDAPETFVGPLIWGRLSGDLVIPLSQAVRDGQGHLVAVVQSCLSARYFANFYQNLGSDPGAVFAIFKADGSLVVRHPLPFIEPMKGVAADGSIFKLLEKGPNGIFLGRSPVDGVVHLGAYRRVAGYPLVVVTGVAYDTLLRDWRDRCERNGGFVALACCLVGLFGWHARTKARQEREAEELLAESERRVKRVADAAPSILWRSDANGRVLWWNEWWFSYSGQSPNHVTGNGWDPLHPDDRGPALEGWRKAVRQGTPFVGEMRYQRHDGRYRWHLVRAEPVLDQHGKPAEWIGVSIDIEEHKELEAALTNAHQTAHKANDAKSRFFAAASHDLRQPFQAIRLFYEVLRQTTLDAQQAVVLRRLGDALLAAEELLNSLLDIAVLDAGQVNVKPFDVDVLPLVEQKIGEMAPLAAEKRLRLSLVPITARVRTDPVMFKRILGNLVSNAIRYTDRGGVLVGFRRREGVLLLEVWDTGRGIHSDRLDEIFEEFAQLENPERNRAKGLGLGLAVVKRMAGLLGHRVGVRSWPGKGSVFSVALPLAGAESAVHPAAPPAVLPARMMTPVVN